MVKHVMLNRCLRCNAVFNRVLKEDLCPQCEDGARRYAQLVDDYLAHKPSRDPGMIAAATGVPRRFVVPYLEAQNPSVAAQAEVVGHCVRCGVKKVGVSPHCKRCMAVVRQKVQEVVQKAENRPDGPGMHHRLTAERRERGGATQRRARED